MPINRKTVLIIFLGLLDAITKIAVASGAADDRRRSEVLSACRTLDDLKAELEKQGYTLSRSALYLRLVPKRWMSHEGKRHVETVPVRLKRPECDSHKQHMDSRFASRVIFDLEEVCSVLGPKQVAFLSCDDKARVPIGLTAANKQAPLLMSTEYRVKLPDHDWVVASRHKLIPSVYAACIVEEGKFLNRAAVTYSGPTHVVIRSGKHDSSTAYSHGTDYNSLLLLDNFKNHLKCDNKVKPVQIRIVDGGPDENPRYCKVLYTSIQYFKENDLDALIIATNAPGRSAFNRVERRMAPLSHDLAGIILPHDYYGTHLDKDGKTIDEELEKKNFGKAGQMLAEVWSKTVINGHPVEATYVEHENTDPPSPNIDHKWTQEHVCQTQYCLQVVKCLNEKCCKPPRSSWHKIMGPHRFLPPPVIAEVTIFHGLTLY